MPARTWKALPSVPRTLALLYALLIGLFALEVFGQGTDFWTTMGAFAIHLIPAAFLGAVLAVAWRNELLGGVLYVALALAYLVVTGGQMRVSAFLLIPGALMLLGVLFLASWRWGNASRRQLAA